MHRTDNLCKIINKKFETLLEILLLILFRVDCILINKFKIYQMVNFI